MENVYHLRLMALLQEVMREKGYKGAARVLEIDSQTVTEAAKTGRLTRRVRQALERALQKEHGSAAARQGERNDRLEARGEALEKGHDELGVRNCADGWLPLRARPGRSGCDGCGACSRRDSQWE